jgi:hypothetical protein
MTRFNVTVCCPERDVRYMQSTPSSSVFVGSHDGNMRHVFPRRIATRMSLSLKRDMADQEGR